MKQRLDKALANNGIGTRKEVKIYIRSNRIFINGKPQKDPKFNIDTEKDIIEFNHKKIHFQKHIYIALNKPKGYVCANKDNLHPTVFDLVSAYKHRKLFVVGRLDIDTTGLVILTDDGKWAHQLKAPKSNTEKEYFVTLKYPATKKDIKCFNGPMRLDDKLLKPALLKDIDKNTCKVVVFEGKFHQVKRMFHKVNNDVLKLHRIRIKNIVLDELDLGLGEYKELINIK